MRVIAAAVQMTSGPDVGANLDQAEALVAEAARRGAGLAVLPENFALLAADDAEAKLRAAEEIGAGDGPIVSRMRALAKRLGVDLVLGGMPERVAGDPGRVHNSSVYVDAAGAVKAVYRKIHLFDVDLPDGATYRESAKVAPGVEPVLVDTPWGGLGMTVCYDVRFPELYRQLALRGARILTVPAAFTLHTGRDHWHVLLRARAIENLAFVVAAAQVGRHSDKRVTYGHALIVDPWGHVLADAGDRPSLAMAELDFTHLEKLRRELPALGHRRL